MPATSKPKAVAKAIPENETSNEAFVRIARGRVTKALHAWRTLLPLGGSAYERTKPQVDKILAAYDAMRAELAASLDPANKGAAKKKDEFQL